MVDPNPDPPLDSRGGMIDPGEVPPTGLRSRWIDFVDMDESLKAEAIAMRPRWPIGDFPRFRFYLKKDGHLSRQAGHHSHTEKTSGAFMAAFKEAYDQTPEMSKRWKSADFTMAPER